MANTAERDDWVTRVLGVGISGTTDPLSAQRAQQAQAENARGIAYPKLLLCWRSAQADALSALQKTGQDFLARPDVQADPRFKDVKAAIDGLPKLIPSLGGELADLLDRGINAGSDEVIADEALEVVDQYRDALAEADGLRAFEQFARKYVGELAAVASLDAALAEIADALEAAL